MQPKHVLIVDDDPAVVLTLSASLEKLGEAYIIDTCTNGTDALWKIEHNTYDLLMTDYSMPGINGIDLAQAVQKIMPAMHIVMMTAYGTSELRQQATALNLTAFVDKPFTVKQIREIITSIVGDGATSPRILIIEDNIDLRRLYSRALTRVGYDVTTTGVLAEAHDLLDRSRFDVLLSDIHVGTEKGTDLVREKYAQLRENKTHIVMITGETWYSDIAKEAGAEFFLEKPVAINTLVALIDRISGRADRQ